MMPSPRRSSYGFSLLEVLVSLAILLIGIVAIIFFFPQSLEAARRAEDRTKAAVLAQMKAEEIRRDDNSNNDLVNAIRTMSAPTAPITFAQEPDLAYQFSGTSILYAGESGPNGEPGIARVIIRYSPEFRRSNNPNRDVLYELRFGP